MTKIEYLCGLKPSDVEGIDYYEAIELKVNCAKMLISTESEKHFLRRDYQRLKLAIEEMENNKEILRER